MKIYRSTHRIVWIGGVLLALLMLGVGTGYYLTRQYPKEWRYWQSLPASAKRLAVELEIERLFHRLFPPSLRLERYAHVTAATLEQAARRGGDWLLAMQEPTGRFQYWYDPPSNRLSHKNDDNFLRQAGTAYALMSVYEMTGDTRYLAGARQNLGYLLQFKKDLDADHAYFLFKRKAKLGGISLPMLTMLTIRRLTGTTEYDALLHNLAQMILFLQDHYHTGQFKSTYVYHGDYEYEKHSGWESKIYPGEALLALAQMYQAFGEPRYKRSMDWALAFYAAKKRWKSHAFLPWTISAFVSLYAQSREPQYAEYVFLLSDYLLTQQNVDGDDEVYGSFHGLPMANTGSYMEGLGDAIHLAQLTGDVKRLERYQERAKMGYRWLLLLQYTEANTTDLQRPAMALGGFRTSLIEAQLRIDNTQHAISAFTKGLRFVFGVEPAVQAALTSGRPSLQQNATP